MSRPAARSARARALAATVAAGLTRLRVTDWANMGADSGLGIAKGDASYAEPGAARNACVGRPWTALIASRTY